MASQPREVHDGPRSAWGAALAPALILLGITLPLIFLARAEQYLYYLAPLELIPTYATAWLLLAVLSVVPVVVAALCLWFLARWKLQSASAFLSLLLLWMAAAAAVVAILLDLLNWALTFPPIVRAGLRIPGETGLTLVALVLGGAVVLTSRGRNMVQRLRTPAIFCCVLGAASLLCLPWFGWQSASSGRGTSANLARAGSGADLSERPHIVLLTIDALSAEHMSLYGARRPTTPELDAFAGTATVFDHAYANGNFTTAGVASILTGTRPWTHRAFQIFSWPTLESRQHSLPEELLRAGYMTGYVATNSYAGAARLGFSPYFQYGRSDRVPMTLPCPDRLARALPYACPASQILPILLLEKLWERAQAASLSRTNRHYDPELAVDTALTWLEHVDKTRPVFIWVHLFPPHAPYAAPAPWLGRFSAASEARTTASSDPTDNYVFRSMDPQLVTVFEARYDEAVQYVDHYAGSFITQALKLLGDNTVVVVMADHGESFANGYGGHGGPGLYDSIIHVPLIIKLPHQAHMVHIETRAEQVDVAPTLAALAQAGTPSSWEGQSLLGLWDTDDPGSSATRPVFAMNFEENHRDAPLTAGSLAVIQGRWKLMHYMGQLHYPQMPALHDELYDISSDPDELTDLAAQQPQETRRLTALATAELARHPGHR